MFIKCRCVLVATIFGLICNPLPARQQAKNQPLRTFVHTRGTQNQTIDSWSEDGTVYIHDLNQGKIYNTIHGGLEEHVANRPALPSNTKGITKFRHGIWWLLVLERGQLSADRVSSLFRFNPKEKQWILLHNLDIRVINFEPLPDNSFFLSGIYSPTTGRRDIAAIISPSGSLNLLGKIPFTNFEEIFWQNCVTTIDDDMVFIYFPYPGNMYGYNIKNHTLRAFRTPWPLITEESIKRDQDAANGKDCFISAVGHPGASSCYFLPAGPGQMVFVYKCLDEEQEKKLAFSDGTRPLVEKVSSFMMYYVEPSQVFELETPSRLQLGQWYWDPILGKFFRWEDLISPSKSIPKKGISSCKSPSKTGPVPKNTER